MRCEECRASLDAYIDQELMPDEMRAVGEHLAQCPDCARDRDRLSATSQAIQEALVRYPAPDLLKARIRSALAEPDAIQPSRRSWSPSTERLIGLALAVGLVGVVTFGVLRTRESATTGEAAVASEVLSSHIRSLMPGHLTDVTSNDTHNVKPWFNGRVDLSPVVPRLDSIGFPLVGGRLDYVAGRTVAAVVYARRQHVINVFSWPAESRESTPATTSVERGYHLVRWDDAGTDYWVVSDLNETELRQFVDAYTRATGR